MPLPPLLQCWRASTIQCSYLVGVCCQSWQDMVYNVSFTPKTCLLTFPRWDSTSHSPNWCHCLCCRNAKESVLLGAIIWLESTVRAGTIWYLSSSLTAGSCWPVLDEIRPTILKTDAIASLAAMLKSQHSWMQLFDWKALSELAKYSMWGLLCLWQTYWPVPDEIREAILQTDAIHSLAAMLKSQTLWAQSSGWRMVSKIGKYGI